MNQIIVEPYNPIWEVLKEKLSLRINSALTGLDCYSIEHVGSTSVVGLAAKPIIDLDIVLQSPDGFFQVKEALEKAGFRHLGDRGITGREVFSLPQDETIPCNLYVGSADAPAIRNHILLRNHLRNHPPAISAYAELKIALAKIYTNDINAYCQAKTDFITELLTQSGLDQQAIEKIRQDNLEGAQEQPKIKESYLQTQQSNYASFFSSASQSVAFASLQSEVTKQSDTDNSAVSYPTAS